MIAVIINEKNQGIPSSGIQFCFWGTLVIYAGIKLRTLILLIKDQVCSFTSLYIRILVISTCVPLSVQALQICLIYAFIYSETRIFK